jgi:hypothetical protein
MYTVGTADTAVAAMPLLHFATPSSGAAFRWAPLANWGRPQSSVTMWSNRVKSPLRTKYQEKAQRAQRFELNQWQFDAEHPQRI